MGGGDVGFAEAVVDGRGKPGSNGREGDEERAREGVMGTAEMGSDENGERGQEGQHVGGQLVPGSAQEEKAPEDGVEVGLERVIEAEVPESRSPGQREADEHGDVEPEGLDVLEVWREEALDVVADDEVVNELLAVGEVAGEIPGEGGEQGGQGSLPVATVEPGDGQTEGDGNEALGENGEAHGKASEPGTLSQSEAQVEEEADAEGDVGDGDLREAEPAQAGAEDEGGLRCGESKEQAEGGEGYGQPGGEIGRNGKLREGSDEPVEERRFLEPRLAPENGSDPVAARCHLVADGGVARLIGAQQATRRQQKQIGDGKRGHEPKTGLRHLSSILGVSLWVC